MATIEHLQQQIRRVSARLGDAAAESNYLRAYGRTMQADIADWQARVTNLQRLTPPVIRQQDGTPLTRYDVAPTHRPYQPAAGVVPAQLAAEDPGGMLQGIGGIFGAVGDVLGGVPRAASAIGGVVDDVLPVVLRFAPVIAVVSLLYAISAVFRIRIKVG